MNAGADGFFPVHTDQRHDGKINIKPHRLDDRGPVDPMQREHQSLVCISRTMPRTLAVFGDLISKQMRESVSNDPGKVINSSS